MTTELPKGKNKIHILESIPQGARGILHTSRALKPRTNCTQSREYYKRGMLLMYGRDECKKRTPHGVQYYHSRDVDLPVFLTSVSGEAGAWAGVAGADDSSVLPDGSEDFAAPC